MFYSGPEGEENFFETPHEFHPPSSFVHLNSFSSTKYSSESGHNDENALGTVQNTLTPYATMSSQKQVAIDFLFNKTNMSFVRYDYASHTHRVFAFDLEL